MDVVPVTIILENILSLNNESLLNSFDINHFFFLFKQRFRTKRCSVYRHIFKEKQHVASDLKAKNSSIIRIFAGFIFDNHKSLN